MQVFLETERLVLRRFTAADVDGLVALDADPAVMRYINGGRPTPRQEVEYDILPAFLGYYDESDHYGFWAVVDQASGTFLGWFHFRPPRDGSTPDPELGFRLRRSAWGRGYGTEGSRALVDKGFRELDIERVWASTMAINVASRRVMEKAGLRFVRLSYGEWPERIEGDEYGDVEYALTRDEWERGGRPLDVSASS